MVEQLFLAVPRGCLQFVIVVFPGHTHLLFTIKCLEIRNRFIQYHPPPPPPPPVCQQKDLPVYACPHSTHYMKVTAQNVMA